MVAWLAALLVFGSAPQITLTVRAAPVARVLEQIAERTALPLVARDPIRQQMLLIDVKDAPVKDLLQRIAEVTHGEWKVEADKRVLTRSPALQRSLEQISIEDSAKSIDEILQKASRKQRPWTPALCRQLARELTEAEARWTETDQGDYELVARLRRELPMPRALIQILSEIGAKTIASVGMDGRLVFSNQPTSKQIRLPAKCDAILSEMRARIGDFDKEFGRQSGVQLFDLGEPFTRTQRVLVTLSPGVAQLRPSGQRWRGMGDAVTFYSDPAQPNRVAHYPAKPIELGEEGQWLAEWWRARVANRVLPRAEGQVRQMLLSPAGQPRVGTLLFDVLKALAEHDRCQLVAWIPMLAEGRLERNLCTELTLSHAESALEASQLNLRRTDGWLLVDPKWPIAQEDSERTREPMQRFVRRAEEVGAIRFLDVAELYHHVGLPLVPREASMLGYESGSPPSSPLVTLVGSMTDPQREAAASPNGIALSQLAPSQRRLAEAAVYALDEWEVAPYEVTDVFPTGLPQEGVFSVRVDRREGAQPWGRDVNLQTSPFLDAERMAAHLATLKRPETEWSGPWAKIDRFRYGTRNAYTMALNFGSLGSMQVEAEEYPQLKGEGVPFQELPSEFRKAVEKLIPPPPKAPHP